MDQFTVTTPLSQEAFAKLLEVFGIVFVEEVLDIDIERLIEAPSSACLIVTCDWAVFEMTWPLRASTLDAKDRVDT